MITALRALSMRFGRPAPKKLANNLALARSTLIFLTVLMGNHNALSWAGLADTSASPWRSRLFWAVILAVVALLAREFAEKFHRSAVRRASQRQLKPLHRLQF